MSVSIEELAAVGAAQRLAEIREEMRALEAFLQPPVVETPPVPAVVSPRRVQARRAAAQPRKPWTRARRKKMEAVWARKRQAAVAQQNAHLRATITRREHVVQAQATA